MHQAGFEQIKTIWHGFALLLSSSVNLHGRVVSAGLVVDPQITFVVYVGLPVDGFIESWWVSPC